MAPLVVLEELQAEVLLEVLLEMEGSISVFCLVYLGLTFSSNSLVVVELQEGQRNLSKVI